MPAQSAHTPRQRKGGYYSLVAFLYYPLTASFTQCVSVIVCRYLKASRPTIIASTEPSTPGVIWCTVVPKVPVPGGGSKSPPDFNLPSSLFHFSLVPAGAYFSLSKIYVLLTTILTLFWRRWRGLLDSANAVRLNDIEHHGGRCRPNDRRERW